MDKEIVLNFICYGKHMVIVKLEHGVHVMDMDEWKRIYKNYHSENWNKNKRRKTA